MLKSRAVVNSTGSVKILMKFLIQAHDKLKENRAIVRSSMSFLSVYFVLYLEYVKILLS